MDIPPEPPAQRRRTEQRRARIPQLRYPPGLPVSQRKDDLLAAIRDHQVVIVAGETGSGKTTQLPKICLELGRGVHGMIGHTQPRRLAARAVADRIAEELQTRLGDVVGYQIRFTAQVGEHTLVKVMTDGILLAELAHDRNLSRYDTLIIDEAHERSLNIDYILGYLGRLLPRRPDLKVIITSATIDPQRFSRHFGDAPVIEVSGRTYPVEVRYRPIEPAEDGADPPDQPQAIATAIDELIAEDRAGESGGSERPGDILVFLSGEREIRDSAEFLRRQARPDTEILPLYARLSIAEQHRVFAPHPGRRIVLATNVAETSLTVPGIKYVVDPGTARISRYSNRLKVQRLPIEPISQASANQRAGRCGRVSDGICIRLYSEPDFTERPAFTEPEILRTNLASVILLMAALNLGEVADFPFVDPPDRRHIKDGIDLLRELGALDDAGGLTPLGRQLARLPIDPRLGRMVLAAKDQGCVAEVLVIAAALSIQDPRERPTDAQAAADAMHARFADPDSDFLSYRNLWTYLADKQRELSGSQFRKLCRTEYLHYLRIREWQDLEGQLRQAAAGLGIGRGAGSAEPDRIHTALLAGLLSHIGRYDSERRDFLGARGARFAISPGSTLFRQSPRWVMAAELVETTRLWGRVAARIDPAWIEPLAGHLVKRSYSEPHWDRKRGAVMAFERVLLYGIPIVASRRVGYGRVDRKLSRELFIRHALVEGDWETRHEFFHSNLTLVAEVEDLEHKARRRDLLVGDEELFDFYDQRIGPEVVSARHFDSWWKKVRRRQPDLLDFKPEMLVNTEVATVDPADYPDQWAFGSIPLPLSYQFEPGTDADGVTVHIPLAALGQVGAESAEQFDWQVPGLRGELVTGLIRAMPKPLRRHFVPAPDTAAAVLPQLRPQDGPLADVLAHQLQRYAGIPVPPSAIQLDRVPPHLRVTYRVVDEAGESLAESKDLAELSQRLRGQARSAVAAAAGGIERSGLTGWDFDALPDVVELQRDGYTVTAYPALVAEPDGVAIRLLPSAAEQAAANWAGTRRLLALGQRAPITYVSNRLSNQAKLVLARNPHGGIGALLDDCLHAAIDVIVADAGGPATNRAEFQQLQQQVRAELNPTLLAVVGRVERVLARWHELERRLADLTGPAVRDSVADIRGQLAGLVYPGFVTATGYQRLAGLPRYLQAIGRRLDRLPEGPARDRELTGRIGRVEQEYRQLLDELAPADRADPEVTEIRWMLEELRISYFAQAQGTAYPVSEKRIYRAIDRVLDH
ncbi:MAG: ATP-dependent RNA helicase HrpA [Sporichthyaceae bacterium]|nr:ATP-dependent RNA helicase HrpA [Sporichthyaceae bacterium]